MGARKSFKKLCLYIRSLLAPRFKLNSKELQGLSDRRRATLAICRGWRTVFHRGGEEYRASEPLVSDQTALLWEFQKHLPWHDLRILEIGSLEGGHSKQLLDQGARSVVGIEGNAESYLKSLVAKSVFLLDDAHFIFGDCNKILERHCDDCRDVFDACFACGVLYHMRDPVKTIELIAHVAPIIYVWTQTASPTSPRGAEVVLSDLAGNEYRGKQNYYGPRAHIGGLAKYAVWLYEVDLLKVFKVCGYEVEALSRSSNESGTAVSFVARRRDYQRKHPSMDTRQVAERLMS